MSIFLKNDQFYPVLVWTKNPKPRVVIFFSWIHGMFPRDPEPLRLAVQPPPPHVWPEKRENQLCSLNPTFYHMGHVKNDQKFCEDL